MPAYLQQEDSTVQLEDGEFIVGRSSGCDLPLDDGLVSRRHALFSLDGDELLIRDLGSRNGTMVNGEVVRKEPVRLIDGDRVTIGSSEFVVQFNLRRRTSKRDRAITSPHEMPRARAPEDETTQASGTALILILAEKAMSLGRYAEAERILKPQLHTLMEQLPSKEDRSQEVERTALTSLHLARGLESTEWVNTVFELFRVSGRIPSAPVVDTLHDVVRAIGYSELKPIRACLKTLSRLESPSPADKFVLQRLRGLEQVIAA